MFVLEVGPVAAADVVDIKPIEANPPTNKLVVVALLPTCIFPSNVDVALPEAVEVAYIVPNTDGLLLTTDKAAYGVLVPIPRLFPADTSNVLANVHTPETLNAWVRSRNPCASFPAALVMGEMIVALGVALAREEGSTKRAAVEPSEVPAAAWAAVASWEIPLTVSEELGAPEMATESTYPLEAIVVLARPPKVGLKS